MKSKAGKMRTVWVAAVALAALVAVLALAGCSGQQDQTSQNASASASSSAASSAASSANSSSSSAASSSSTATSSAASTSSKSSSAAQGSISEQQAKDIALKHAGLAESAVTFVKLGQEQDDGILKWDVEFVANGTEYDYDIDANTGDIVSFDNEIADSAATAQNVDTSNYIGEDAAKTAALARAGLAETDVTMTKCKLDLDDMQPHYEVGFVANGVEYDCDIDAVTGDVLAYEEDIND